ncbi:membrane protein [soil metagenome]
MSAPDPGLAATSSPERVSTELVAVIVSLDTTGPMVLTAPGGTRLPAGPLRTDHRSLQTGVRAWVEQQSELHLGYVEQLYTFADPDRGDGGDRVISVSYLGLTRATSAASQWHGFYEFFPWEDHRSLDDGGRLSIAARLQRWAGAAPDGLAAQRAVRCAVTFGLDGRPWRPELALQRYELLHEAGLIPESPHTVEEPVAGVSMEHDHRRILATGIARLRAKIQYRPVVFELMPDAFTLGQLQGVVESLAGQGLHKQNFRRLITQQDLVEETGATDQRTGGRPAKLYAFRGDVLDERGVAGTKLPLTRSQ